MKNHRCDPTRQLEHLTVNQGVVGSSPTVGANEKASNMLAFLLFQETNNAFNIIYMFVQTLLKNTIF